MNDANLKIPEERFRLRARRESLVVTFLFHAGLLALFSFWTCAAPTEPPEEMVEITWGGSGGLPGVDAPIGPTPKGEPDASPRQPTPNTAPRKEPEKIKTPVTKSPSTEKIPATEEKPEEPKKPSSSTDTPARDPADNSNSSDKPSNNGSQVGRPDGTGDRPAGGSGGATSGYSVGGLGSRRMTRGAGARYPEGSNSQGTVVLRFTVLPNGSITNITPVKRADAALVNAAMAGLRKAKFAPLPDNAPQESQSGTITYRFELR